MGVFKSKPNEENKYRHSRQKVRWRVLRRNFWRFSHSKFFVAMLVLPLFIAAAIWTLGYVPDVWVGTMMIGLYLAVWLFVFEVFPVDIASLSLLVGLGIISWAMTSLVGLEHGILPLQNLFSGFGGNAVMSIIAAMIISSGLDRAGIMEHAAQQVLKLAGDEPKKITAIVSLFAAAVSAFMPNVGAAALFLPVCMRISSTVNIPVSSLLMPMAYAVICGGVITTVGSSSLIMLNDLLANSKIAPDSHIDLFGIAPVGIVLTAVCIAYFWFIGDKLLPVGTTGRSVPVGTMDYLRRVYGLSYGLYEVRVPGDSPATKLTIGDIERRYAVRVVATRDGRKIRLAPGGLSSATIVGRGTYLALMGSQYAIDKAVEELGLEMQPQLREFADTLTQSKAGIAEVVIPHGSNLVGQRIRETWLRKTYGLTVLAIQRGDDTLTNDVIDIELHAGDILVSHTKWETLSLVEENSDLVLITSDFPRDDVDFRKIPFALAAFIFALALVVATSIPVSLALMSGAVAMVLTGVLNMDQAYRSISWKTVFMLACLIPIGTAVDATGTASWLSGLIIKALGDVPAWVLATTIGLMATFSSMIMSNVGATVLLVPIAMNLAIAGGANPIVFAVIVGILTNNAFMIPTNQVNVLIMGPGSYSTRDFLRVGALMTPLFLITSLVMIYFTFQ